MVVVQHLLFWGFSTIINNQMHSANIIFFCSYAFTARTKYCSLATNCGKTDQRMLILMQEPIIVIRFQSYSMPGTMRSLTIAGI